MAVNEKLLTRAAGTPQRPHGERVDARDANLRLVLSVLFSPDGLLRGRSLELHCFSTTPPSTSRSASQVKECQSHESTPLSPIAKETY